MTAGELSKRAGCIALDLARRVGIRDEVWRKMVHRDTPLTTPRSPERGKKIAQALDEVIAEMKKLRRDLGDK